MDNPSLSSEAVIAVFFGIVIALTILIFILLLFYIKYRKNPVIRRDTPNVTFVMLIAGLASGIALILFCIGTTTALCIIEGFFSYAGTSVLMAGIIAKSYRIYRIFNNRTAVALVIKDWQLLCIMLGVFVYFELAFGLSLITGYGAYTAQSSSNPFYIFTACTFPDSFWRTFFRVFFAISYVLLVFVAIIFGFLTRHVPTTFGSTSAIYICAVTVLMTYIVFQPLYYTTSGSTDSQTVRAVIKLEMSIINMLAFIAIFFIPTLYKAYKHEKRMQRRLARVQ